MKHPLTYEETLIDYHLCTHPKYKYTQEPHQGSSIPLTQKQFLHHTVMSAPGLAELALDCVQGQGTGGVETAVETAGRLRATVRKAEGGMLGLSSLYSVWDLSLWDNTAHI